MHRSFLAAIVAVGLSGCLSATDFCTQLQNAEAARNSECNGGAAEDWQVVINQLFTCEQLDKAVTAKRAAYDGSKANDCLAAVKSTACGVGALALNSASCQAAMKGTIAVGSPCYGGAPNCVPDAYCDLTANTCPGTCKAYAKAGDACAQGQVCAPGTACGSSSLKCLAATAGDGQSCDRANGPLCADGARCTPSTAGATAGTCHPGGSSGDCHDHSDCAKTAYCKGGDPSTTGKCTPQVAVGAACTSLAECPSLTTCDPSSKTCVRRARVGSPCPGSGSLGCLDGYCDGSTKTCLAYKAPGAACDPADYEPECGLFVRCDVSAKTCPATCTQP